MSKLSARHLAHILAGLCVLFIGLAILGSTPARAIDICQYSSTTITVPPGNVPIQCDQNGRVKTIDGAGGAAGSPNSSVTTVQGIPGGTPQNVTADSVIDNVTCVGSGSAGGALTWSGPAGVCNGMAYINSTGYGAMSFQIVANASSNTLTFEGSNDLTNFVGIWSRRVGDGSFAAGTLTSSFPSGTALAPTVIMSGMRARISTFVGGTVTVNATLKRTAAPNALDVYATINPVAGNPTDGTIVLTTGGTSQQVFAANTGRRFLRCQNPSAAVSGVAAESVFINYGVAASATPTAGNGSEEIANGGSVTFDSSFVPAGTINVVATTTGHRIVCKQN